MNQRQESDIKQNQPKQKKYVYSKLSYLLKPMILPKLLFWLHLLPQMVYI